MITKQHLIDHLVAERHGVFTKASAAAVVDDIFRWLSQGIRDNGEVRIPGFGSFSVTYRKARTGVHPATGEAINIPEKRVVKFKASAALNSAVRS